MQPAVELRVEEGGAALCRIRSAAIATGKEGEAPAKGPVIGGRWGEKLGEGMGISIDLWTAPGTPRCGATLRVEGDGSFWSRPFVVI